MNFQQRKMVMQSKPGLENSWNPWSAEEDSILMEQCADLMDNKSIAELHCRTAGSIKARQKILARKLMLDESFTLENAAFKLNLSTKELKFYIEKMDNKIKDKSKNNSKCIGTATDIVTKNDNRCEAMLCLINIIDHFQSHTHWENRSANTLNTLNTVNDEYFNFRKTGLEKLKIQNFERFVSLYEWTKPPKAFLKYISDLGINNYVQQCNKYDFYGMLSSIEPYLINEEICNMIISYDRLIYII
jgi:hypothetical protein